MSGLIIILIVILAIWFLGPIVRRAMQQYMLRRTEDFIRQATGMPPRSGSRQDRRQQRGQSTGHRAYYSGKTGSATRFGSIAAILQAYAEDAEIIEFYAYSEYHVRSDGNSFIYTESQVSDAEYIILK